MTEKECIRIKQAIKATNNSLLTWGTFGVIASLEQHIKLGNTIKVFDVTKILVWHLRELEDRGLEISK